MTRPDAELAVPEQAQTGAAEASATETAAALLSSLGLVYRRLKQPRPAGELTLPESAAISWLSRSGPMTAADLARKQQITPQSIAHTLQGLEERGLIRRVADPTDGRRQILSLTDSGAESKRIRRERRGAELSRALSENFTAREMQTLTAAAELLERLAQVDWQ